MYFPDERPPAASTRASEHHPTTPVQCSCGWRETDPGAGTWMQHMVAADSTGASEGLSEAERVTHTLRAAWGIDNDDLVNWIVARCSHHASAAATRARAEERERIAQAVTEHADHMETYTLPALQPGFMDGWTHALRLLRRDAMFIAERAARGDDA